MVDTFLLLTLARTGDSLQGIKKGVLELADVIAVNKADGDHVRRRQGRGARAGRRAAPDGARRGRLDDAGADVQRHRGTGLDAVWDQLRAHRQHLERTGQLAEQRRRQDVRWMWSTIDDRLLARFRAAVQRPGGRARGAGPPRRHHPDRRRRGPARRGLTGSGTFEFPLQRAQVSSEPEVGSLDEAEAGGAEGGLGEGELDDELGAVGREEVLAHQHRPAAGVGRDPLAAQQRRADRDAAAARRRPARRRRRRSSASRRAAGCRAARRTGAARRPRATACGRARPGTTR